MNIALMKVICERARLDEKINTKHELLKLYNDKIQILLIMASNEKKSPVST